jgi:hypothetical protein
MTPSRAHLPSGWREVSKISTTRRGTAAAGMIPVLTMPRPSGSTGGVFSQGRRPAESRHACTSTRVPQNGGQPIHTAPARRGNLQGRSPPRPRPRPRHRAGRQRTERQRPSQKPRQRQKGCRPRKRCRCRYSSADRNTGAASLLIPLSGWRSRFPGPQEHRRAEKGHPRGDPDLFPGALDRPAPCCAGLTQPPRAGHRFALSGAIQGHPARPQTKPNSTATKPHTDSTT